MLTRSLAVVFAVGVVALPLEAQVADPQCAPGAVGSIEYVTSDACQKAVDLFRYMSPQLGISLTGGNALLGVGGTVGGLGKVRIDARLNGLYGSLPQIQAVVPQAGPAQSTTYTTKTQIMGLPAATAEIGLFRGLALPIGHVGGVDALVTGMYVPNLTANSISLQTVGSNLKMGYGARIGILEETLPLPGVSFSWMRRDLPTLNIAGSIPSGSGTTTTLQIDKLSARTTAWRLVASKNLIPFLFGIAAGMGQDKYESGALVTATVDFGGVGASRPPVAMAQTLTRTNYFVDASLNVFVMKLFAEGGIVQGGDVPTFNKFDKPADDKRYFGSLGMRFDFPPF
jgi:hypothetical protein